MKYQVVSTPDDWVAQRRKKFLFFSWWWTISHRERPTREEAEFDIRVDRVARGEKLVDLR